MANETIFVALADPSRRMILERLRDGPLAVRPLADVMPISRPAVSQHLKVLSDAGLLEVEACGTRRIYRISREGAAQLRAYADALWGDALTQFAQTTGKENPMPKDALAPVVKTLTVPVNPDEAFRRFTQDMGNWWPVDTHSLSAGDGKLPQKVDVTPEAVTETKHDGTQGTWGRVTAFEPGARFAMDWHVGRPADEATFLDVRFEARGDGTRITLIHDGWDVLGDAGQKLRDGYHTGWDHVLGTCFAGACNASALV